MSDRSAGTRCCVCGPTPRECLADSVRSVYFHWTDLNDVMSDSWPSLVADLKSDGYEFWTTAEAEEGFPIPEGLKEMGFMTRNNYELMIGSAKVLLGIGKPEISPSVYTAL